MKKEKIIIIGGGLAGLTTAYYLLKQSKNINITIIEARDRLGGRIFSPAITRERERVDVGAFMIFPFYKEFKKLLKELNLHQKTRKINDREFFHFENLGWISDKIITPWSFFPWRMFLKNIKTFLTHRINYYEPNLDIFPNLSIHDLLKQSQVSSEKIKIIDTLITAYTYPKLQNIPAALSLPIGIKLSKNGMFNRCKVLENGTQELITTLEKKIKNKGGKIIFSEKAEEVKNNSIILGNKKEIFFNELIIATFSKNIFSKIIKLEKQVHHTTYDFLIIKLKENSKLNKGQGWFMSYETPPKNNRKPYFSSFVKLSSYTNLSNNYIGGYLKWPQNLTQKSFAETKKIAVKLIEKDFDNKVEEICDIQRWDFTMPIMSVNEIKQLRTIQGKNNIWFAGDYLGLPSMDTAVYTGRKAAENILKKLKTKN